MTNREETPEEQARRIYRTRPSWVRRADDAGVHTFWFQGTWYVGREWKRKPGPKQLTRRRFIQEVAPHLKEFDHSGKSGTKSATLERVAEMMSIAPSTLRRRCGVAGFDGWPEAKIAIREFTRETETRRN